MPGELKMKVREATAEELKSLAAGDWEVYCNTPLDKTDIVLPPEQWKKFCELAGLDETGRPKVG